MVTEWVPRAQLTPEQLEEYRRKNRRRAKMRRIGKPASVSPGPTVRYVRMLHDEGAMTLAEIGDAAGLALSTISDLYRNTRGPESDFAPLSRLPRVTEAKVFSVPMPPLPNDQSNVLVDILGVRRRLQALGYMGFTVYAIADWVGYSDHNIIWRMMTGKGQRGNPNSRVTVATRTKIYEAYDKLSTMDPKDLEISNIGISRAKATARRNGYAPPSAWDEDTIDDPSASPEWTGECGTPEGYRIHVREMLLGNELPLCMPCRRAVELKVTLPLFTLRADRLKELMEEQGTNTRRLSRAVDINSDSLYHYLRGTRHPRHLSIIAKLADHLQVPLEELVDFTTEEEYEAAPLVTGAFNRHVFVVALDLKGLSRQGAATLLDITPKTLSNWASGLRSPGSPERLKALAQMFKVKPEVFFS